MIDRHPWRLALYRLQVQRLAVAAESTVSGGEIIESEVLPFTLRLIDGSDRPQIEVLHNADQQRWAV